MFFGFVPGQDMVPEQEDQVEKDRQHIERRSSRTQEQQFQVLGRRKN